MVASRYPHWMLAMDDEYNALMRNNTWTLVPASPSMNVIGCKWVFKVKRKPDGSIDCYKASLVAKSHSDASLIYSHSPVGSIFILIYVDDIIGTDSTINCTIVHEYKFIVACLNMLLSFTSVVARKIKQTRQIL
ncbi:uncharacterized protein LOC111371838 [Olea europaea var. sylvestris]|uniref:uncharacterized protein LOC111371838 n=1 Tax=Olea europaea var. sylvestris TaxID=158386 RepID=UPI000C1D2851|nr:uncharacterized protein LOC111371838 [Olea europaea var. sylvestris]